MKLISTCWCATSNRVPNNINTPIKPVANENGRLDQLQGSIWVLYVCVLSGMLTPTKAAAAAGPDRSNFKDNQNKLSWMAALQ